MTKEKPLDPSHLVGIGMGFWASKALLTAVELDLFTALGAGSLTAAELASKLGLHPRAVPDFPDALVALRVLDRDGDGSGARYKNTPESAAFLDRKSPQYLAGFLEMSNARLYRFWGDLGEALKTGKPQNEIKHTGESMFAKLYESREGLEQFMRAMRGASAANFALLAEKFDFKRYRTLCDVGGATAQLSCAVAARHPHMHCMSVDLPAVVPIAQRFIDEAGLSERVTSATCDFFVQDLPKADVLTMGMILHDWNLEKKRLLVKKAFDALPAGGAFVVIESLIDDARRENASGLLMSLNMLIEFGDAFDYTAKDFFGWCKDVGFREFEVIKLAGPSSAAIAFK
jgi:hypothetical protein